MLEQFLTFHFFTKMRESVGPFVKIRLINLEYIACENHLGAFSGPGYDCLDFVRREVLRLVADEIDFAQTSASDVGQRRNQALLAIEHLFNLKRLLACRSELASDDVEIVH